MKEGFLWTAVVREAFREEEGHKLSFKSRKIEGRRGHFQMVKAIEGEKMK